jgi:hypothetical protein
MQLFSQLDYHPLALERSLLPRLVPFEGGASEDDLLTGVMLLADMLC